MPELPDVTVYVEAVAKRIVGHRLLELQLLSPFVLRSVEPHREAFVGKRVTGTSRIGKRIVLELEDELFAVMHLMIAGRLHWLAPGTKLHRKRTLLAWVFEHGILQLTEAGSKRALTDPRVFDGIGNSYSDEILHAAKLSPIKLTSKLDDDEVARLHEACVAGLAGWTERLRQHFGDAFPEQVTSFWPDMAVHGKYGQPCPVCGEPIQRIVYASRETNYCPGCQTGGKLLADRGLSRLLAQDWPRSLEELESYKAARRSKPTP